MDKHIIINHYPLLRYWNNCCVCNLSGSDNALFHFTPPAVSKASWWCGDCVSEHLV